MTRLLRRMVVALAASSSLFAPLNSVAESVLDFSLRSENRLAMTMLSDAFSDSEVTFSASQENGVTDIQIDLDGQSIYLWRREGELHIHSSKNTARTYSTLSEEEKVVLGTMANLMEESLELDNRFYAATVCLMKHFADWPPEMPLTVSLDPIQVTVGDLRLDREEMKEARRQALAEAAAREQEEAPQGPAAWTSLCDVIGTKQWACYPTGISPYIEKCERKLVGGRTCRARCGTTCTGLCDGTKYTQDCFDHDRCADVYGRYDYRCDYIFAATMDDCTSAPDCNDIPGVWNVSVTYDTGGWGTGTWYIHPRGTFTDNLGYGGGWTWFPPDGIRLTYYSAPYCFPIYTGWLNADRLKLSGDMYCTEWYETGSWVATKTNGAVPNSRSIQSQEHRNDGPVGLTGGRAPSPTDSPVNPPHTEVEK